MDSRFKFYDDMTKAEQARHRACEKAGTDVSKHLRAIAKIIDSKADRGSVMADKTTLDLLQELEGRSAPFGWKRKG